MEFSLSPPRVPKTENEGERKPTVRIKGVFTQIFVSDAYSKVDKEKLVGGVRARAGDWLVPNLHKQRR
jgi:hypothetical protein